MTLDQKSTSSISSTINLDKLDQMLGLRAWGLILYGALPASLSLLGVVEVKVAQINKVVPMLAVSILPLIVTFLLVRARQKEWYFTTDYLNLRSTITTLLIVITATLIAGASGIIREKYHFSPLDLRNQNQLAAYAESFLFGMASLVISSSIFATILTKGADLPGLPASGFITSIAKMRQQLIAIQNSSIWQRYDYNQDTTVFDELKQTRDSIIKDLEAALSQPGNKLAKRGLQPLRSQLDVFARSITEIKEGQIKDTIEFRWRVRFADPTTMADGAGENLQHERDAIKDEIAILKTLKNLRLGG
ncbi:MAG TPA: hypothetical protein VGJ37_04960 [Pyrinomonadaceae bacterium]|jgi:hypothetical protein